MESKKKVMLFLGLAIILVVSACSTQTAVTTAPTVNSVPEATQLMDTEKEVDIESFTDAEMEAFILKKAAGNHTLEFILDHDMSAEEWSETLDRMIEYGADINPEEKEAIIEWLVNRK
ncbi:MAG: hypothetical protein M0P11_08225 [Anaerolineaceae bacterium]|nr:hypothetical protein [Anaerolineaceae bacterium]